MRFIASLLAIALLALAAEPAGARAFCPITGKICCEALHAGSRIERGCCVVESAPSVVPFIGAQAHELSSAIPMLAFVMPNAVAPLRLGAPAMSRIGSAGRAATDPFSLRI